MKDLRRKPRYQVQRKNEGVFEGKVFVKKANSWLEYTRFNTPNKPDIEVWT